MAGFKLFCLLALAVILAGCDSREEKLVAWVKQSPIDPHKLQEWSVAEIQKHEIGYFYPPKDWPAYLMITNEPSSIYVTCLENKERMIYVSWGSGFGHWGIVVGNTNFVMTDEGPGRPVFQWIPGVYIAPYSEH